MVVMDLGSLNNQYYMTDDHQSYSTVCTVWLPIEFHGFTIKINCKGYHSLVPVLISFLETEWVPLNIPSLFIHLGTCISIKLNLIDKHYPSGEYSNIKNFDDIARMKYKKYGSIVRQEYIPGMFITSLFEPSDFEKVYKKEGDERLRPQFDFAKLYFESRKREPSLTAR